MMKLIINTMREGYGLDQIKGTMTAGELREFLEDYDDETPIYLSFDNGYTYGSVNRYRIEESYPEEEEEEKY